MKDYKRLSPVIWQGDLYNLRTRFHEVLPVKRQGPDPARCYRLTEINLMPGQQADLPANGQTYSGNYLQKVGVVLSDPAVKALTSHVLEVTGTSPPMSPSKPFLFALGLAAALPATARFSPEIVNRMRQLSSSFVGLSLLLGATLPPAT